MSARLLLAGLLIAGGCAYHPAPQVDTGSAAYQKDLDACRAQSASAVDQANAKRALAWFSGPVRRWGQISDATRECMEAKGYGGLRWCTAAELQGSVVVTAEGIQCSEPKRAR